MRLRHPELGTVIEVGDDLGSQYRARGWVDADGEKKPPRRRSRKDDDTDASGNDRAE